MSFLARRHAEKKYREGGWGPLLTYPVTREGGPPLVFQMRLPLGTRLVDLGTLATGSPGAPDVAVAGAEAVAAVAPDAGAFVVGALCGTGEDDQLEVLGTLTVALGDVAEALEAEEGETTDRATRTYTRVTRLSDRVVEIRRQILVDVPGRDEPAPLVILQYLMQSRYGALSINWGTTHTGMMNQAAADYFLKITSTTFIGETPQEY